MLDYYVSREYIIYWLLSSVIFTMIFVGNEILLYAHLFFEKGVDLRDLAMMIAYKVPFFYVVSFPIATFFAIILTMGKLGKNSELDAMRSSGIRLYRIMQPMIFLSLAISFLTFLFNEEIVPPTYERSKDLQVKIKHRDRKRPKTDGFIRTKDGATVHLKTFNNETGNITNVEILEIVDSDAAPEAPVGQEGAAAESVGDQTAAAAVGREPAPPPRIAFEDDAERSPAVTAGIEEENPEERKKPVKYILTTAQQGSIKTNENQLTLLQPKQYRFDEDGVLLGEIKGRNFITHPLAEAVTEQLKHEETTPKQKTLRELKRDLAQRREGGLNTDVFLTEYYLKYSRPASSLIFALVALPLSVQSARRERFNGLAVSLLLMVGYFTVLAATTAFGNNGLLDPLVAAWSPNVLFFLLGLGLIGYSNRY